MLQRDTAVLYWFCLGLSLLVAGTSLGESIVSVPSSRVEKPEAWAKRDGSGYAYRQQADLILARLDIRPGDSVLDLGAGDGWWTAKFADLVGTEGRVFAAEVAQELVNRLENRFRDVPQVKAYLCPKDSPGLTETTLDLVFISQVYHHLEGKSRADYWRELAKVVKREGRVAVIETYPQIALRGKDHGTPLSVLVNEAEQGGWVPVEIWFIPATQHYLAIFAQQQAFFPADN